MNNPLKQSFDALGNWLTRIGGSRDGLLVLGGLLYILGYIVWSIHAYEENLGLLPALEAQYFIAGIVPLFICALIYAVCRASWMRKLHLPGWLNVFEKRRWLRNFLVVAIVVSTVLDRFELLKYLGGLGEYLAIRNKWIFIGVVFLVFLLSLPTIDPTRDLKLRTSPTKVNFSALVAVLIWAFGIYAMYAYITLLYSRLPQALGGVQPRCAYLDFQRNGLSKETLQAILPLVSSGQSKPSDLSTAGGSTPTVTPIPSNDIVRSEKVEVLFSGSDYLLIRIHKQVYEIKKDFVHAVQAVQSCDLDAASQR